MTHRADPSLGKTVQSVGQALAGSDVLASLTARVRASQSRLSALHDVLPAPIRAQLQPGPIDEQGFTLLASSQAVAAKLRYMLPSLEAHLVRQGFAPLPIRVKVLAPR